MTLLAICLVAGTAAFASPAAAATFSNLTPMADPSQSGPLQPYPSTISVSGLPGTIVKAQATLIDIYGGPARDLDVLLVGPGGSTLLISDICSAGGFVPDLIHLTYTFDDAAAAPLPETCTGAPASGTYKPTNYDTADNFPGIPPPYLLGLTNVRGISPNGDWQLYAFDDTYPDPWTIGGWSLDLTTTGAPAAATHKRRCKKGFVLKKVNGKKKCVRKKKRR